MSDGLTLSEAGAAEISDDNQRELIQMIRATVQRIEDLYRPTRVLMRSNIVSSDPVMLGLYGARDALIDAEKSILALAFVSRP